MDVNVILNDFERLKKACDDMAGKIGRASCRERV